VLKYEIKRLRTHGMKKHGIPFFADDAQASEVMNDIIRRNSGKNKVSVLQEMEDER